MPRHQLLIRCVTVTSALFFAACVFWIVYLVHTGTYTKSIFYAVFIISDRLAYGDKIGHFLLFGPFTLAVNILLNFKQFRKSVYLGSLLVFCFTMTEELSQQFLPTRKVELLDIVANIAGILLFTWCSLKIEQLLRLAALPKHDQL